MPPYVDTSALDAFIAQQRRANASVIAAIKAVRTEFDLGLGLAKRLVESHPDWFSEVAANRPFQDEVARIFEEMDGASFRPASEAKSEETSN